MASTGLNWQNLLCRKMRPSRKVNAELCNTVQQSPLMEHRRQKLQLQIVYPQVPRLWKPYCSKINADTSLQYTATLSGLLFSRTQVASESASEKQTVFCLCNAFVCIECSCALLLTLTRRESTDISADFSFLVFFPNWKGSYYFQGRKQVLQTVLKTMERRKQS